LTSQDLEDVYSDKKGNSSSSNSSYEPIEEKNANSNENFSSDDSEKQNFAFNVDYITAKNEETRKQNEA